MNFKRILFGVLFLFTLGASLTGQSNQYAVWDYPDAEISEVTEFQYKLNNDAYKSVGLPGPLTLPDTQTGHKSFRFLLPVVSQGQTHTLYVRACNAVECSWDASHVFKFVGPPSNLRIHKSGE